MDFTILNKVNFPSDLKNLSTTELEKLCFEIRQFMIHEISKVGGHLGAGLGVVELSVALHYVFNAPKDKLIWDIGHQSYPHKILTGRKKKLSSVRQKDGISGFCSITESVYDTFGAGHSSTSISAGIGIAKARDLMGENFNVISIIGDSAMTAGIAYEAMNNASDLKSKMIVILNDNDMSISPAVGALREYLAHLITSNGYVKARNFTKKIFEKLPKIISFFKHTETAMKDMITGGNLFEAMGFYYIGPVDGHDLGEMIEMLERVRDLDIKKPILLHVRTEKGKGYGPAGDAHDKLHGVSKFDIETGEQVKSDKKTYTDIFAESLLKLAEGDNKIIAITAGMPSGTGLLSFQERFPERFVDVAIAEQHAVTFAAGLAISGFKPYVAIYSTFLQRAYDQVIHDVCLQNLPVRFMLDRSGFVGPDGATHAGSFDISSLCMIPNLVIMAPSSGEDFAEMMKLSSKMDKNPCVIRYPKDFVDFDKDFDFNEIRDIEIGKVKTVFSNDSDFLILSCGALLENAIKARDLLKKDGVELDIFDARFIKPIDSEFLIKNRKKKAIFTLEEGSGSGFGGLVAKFTSDNSLDVRIFQICMPDLFIEHASIEDQRDLAGLSSGKIYEFIGKAVKKLA